MFQKTKVSMFRELEESMRISYMSINKRKEQAEISGVES